MYEDKRSKIELSEECWKCLEIIKNGLYANNFTLFLISDPELIQQLIRKKAPGIQGGLLRYRHEGKLVTFSLSKKAIIEYKPKILELSFFGSAVKILGAYESYVLDIVKISNKIIPEEMEKFRNKHTDKKLKFHPDQTRSDKKFIHPKLGRGIVFFEEVFGFHPHSSYKPSLNFFFELRNTAVHRMNITDETLYGAAKSDFIDIKGNFEIGDPVEWNLSLILQLIQLVNSVLSEVDPKICSILELLTVTKRELCYLDEEIGY